MELLERFALGDREAFEAVFQLFQGEVYAWIVRIVRDRAAAEDLTVETFWKIWRARGRFDPAREFGAWARRIATHTAIDYLKRARRETGLPPNLPEAPLPDPAEQRELHDAVRRAFRALPVKLQAVATLALIEQRPHAEIAEALGISRAAVKSREFRAVHLLRKKLSLLGWSHAT